MGNKKRFPDRKRYVDVRFFVTDAIVHEYYHEENVKKARAKREQYEYQRGQEERTIRQELDFKKNHIVDILYESALELRTEIVEFIASKLSIKASAKEMDPYKKKISFEEIKGVVDLCLPAIQKLKDISNTDEVDIKPYRNTYTEYEALFNDLLDLDIRFIYFAPVNCFERATVGRRLKYCNNDILKQLETRAKKFKNDRETDYLAENKTTEVASTEVQIMIDKFNEVEFKSKYDMVCVTESLASDIHRFILKHLKDADCKTLSYKQMNEVFEVVRPSLNSLKELCQHKDLQEVAGWAECDPYTELFNRLIDINIKFAFHAPTSSLNRLDIDFSELGSKEKALMVQLLERKGLWDNREYYDNYYWALKGDDNIKTNSTEEDLTV